jgi:hypothetical protein
MQVIPLYAESPEDLISAIRGASLERPSLGIIFSSVFLNIPGLSESLSQVPYPVAGCSSSGEIMSGRGSPVSELSAVGSLLDPDPGSVRVNLFDRGDMTCYELGRAAGTWGSEQFRNPVFMIFISGVLTDAEQIIRGIESVFALPPPLIYGGMAGDEGTFEETYVFTNGRYSTDGLLAVVFDHTTIELSGVITSGWRGIGGEKRVTRSDGNKLFTIEGKPALDLYKNYLRLRNEDIPRLSMDFPLIVKRTDGAVVIRTPTGVDAENGALIFAGSIPEGSMVTFSSNVGREAIQNSIREIKQNSDQIRDAELMVLFSCKARHQAVGKLVEEEINSAIEAGNSLLIGFFSYGEVGQGESGICEFFNETFTLVTLSERGLS